MIKQSKYLLLYHQFYADRIAVLLDEVEALYKKLPREKYLKHPMVKLLARMHKADQEIIPSDPNKKEYFLRGPFAKFRRYKQGLGRYRLIFCFSNMPSIIVYLYVNDENHMRKDGDKNDPYNEFARMVRQGVFSHNPQDSVMQRWIQKKNG